MSLLMPVLFFLRFILCTPKEILILWSKINAYEKTIIFISDDFDHWYFSG